MGRSPVRQAGLQLEEILTGHRLLQKGTGHESQLLRTACSRSCRRHQQSALSGYLSIPACPSDVCAAVQASLPICASAVRGFQSKLSRKLDAFAFGCPFRPCLRHGLQPFLRSRCPLSISNQACRGLPTWAPAHPRPLPDISRRKLRTRL